jgi:DNA topoisomerase-1
MPSKLVFADDDAPGITRRQIRGHWAYFRQDGDRIEDRDEIDRLNRIALPPAYCECWYSPDPKAHLLAFGFDMRGRKQYRYHPDWRAEREARKFELCADFGRALPRLRKCVESDLTRRKLSRERAIASVVALLDTGSIRVGNETYARQNKSFGATTLRNRHAGIERGRLRLRFRGKSGKLQEIDCDDARLIRCVRRMQDLPGQRLFQYLDAEGAPVPVSSEDVNCYIHETMGAEFTARNFRTWTASAIAFGLIRAKPELGLKTMIEQVAGRLGNTPAIARKSYVHPAVIAAARREVGFANLVSAPLPRQTRWLSSEERGLIRFLDAASRLILGDGSAS